MSAKKYACIEDLRRSVMRGDTSYFQKYPNSSNIRQMLNEPFEFEGYFVTLGVAILMMEDYETATFIRSLGASFEKSSHHDLNSISGFEAIHASVAYRESRGDIYSDAANRLRSLAPSFK